MSKRLFLTALGIVSTIILCSPDFGHARRGLPDFVVEKSCGDNNTEGAVLIAYASNYGSTYRVADVVAEVFCSEGFKVDLRSADNVTQTDLADYDAVILGSNIYIEKWNAEALAFLEENKDALATKNLAYFCVNGLLGMNFDGKEALVEEHYVQPMYGLYGLNPKDVAAFAGAVDYRILKLKDWMMLHLMFMPRGNWTDYAQVVSWAYAMSQELK